MPLETRNRNTRWRLYLWLGLYLISLTWSTLNYSQSATPSLKGLLIRMAVLLINVILLAGIVARRKLAVYVLVAWLIALTIEQIIGKLILGVSNFAIIILALFPLILAIIVWRITHQYWNEFR